MKVVVQSVVEASCVVDGQTISQINRGYLLLVGLNKGDTEVDVVKMAQKIAKLRFLCDKQDKINLNIQDIQGEILSISQFTLAGTASKGNRPEFSDAMAFKQAKQMYQLFNEELRKQSVVVYEGVFGGDMKIHLINDGPLTLILDSKELV